MTDIHGLFCFDKIHCHIHIPHHYMGYIRLRHACASRNRQGWHISVLGLLEKFMPMMQDTQWMSVPFGTLDLHWTEEPAPSGHSGQGQHLSHLPVLGSMILINPSSLQSGHWPFIPLPALNVESVRNTWGIKKKHWEGVWRTNKQRKTSMFSL